MANHEKIICDFLDAAVDRSLLTKAEAVRLAAFARSDGQEHKGWFSLSAAMGLLGALALAFGAVLLISANWYMFSDIAKLSGFLVLLVVTHAAAQCCVRKGHEKTGSALHFLGAGLCLAGIGLIAQIFHLHSSSGESFLLWLVMILPLAVLLRNGPILLLSVVAFTLWGNMQLDYLHGSGWLSALAFNASVCFAMVAGGLVLKEHGSSMSAYLQVPGMIGVMLWLYIYGFTHEASPRWFKGDGDGVLILVLLLALTVALLGYQWFRSAARRERYFLLGLGVGVLAVLLLIAVGFAGSSLQGHYEHNAFGRMDKVYYLPFFVSLAAWVSYFALALWGVVYGALQHQRWMLNCSVLLVGIGIFTRFMDLLASMMDTGLLFVASGVVLLGLGFGLEKWRRRLIAQAQA